MKFFVKCLLILFIFSVNLHTALYAEEAAQPYSKDEFPETLWDIRRAEIITLGSLPFTTLLSTISYSFYRYYDHDFESSYVPNPLAKTSDAANLNSSEQKLVIGMAAGISVSIGLIDLFANNMTKRRKLQQKQGIGTYGDNIIIVPLEENEEENKSSKNKYLYGGMQSALF